MLRLARKMMRKKSNQYKETHSVDNLNHQPSAIGQESAVYDDGYQNFLNTAEKISSGLKTGSIDLNTAENISSGLKTGSIDSTATIESKPNDAETRLNDLQNELISEKYPATLTNEQLKSNEEFNKKWKEAKEAWNKLPIDKKLEYVGNYAKRLEGELGGINNRVTDPFAKSWGEQITITKDEWNKRRLEWFKNKDTQKELWEFYFKKYKSRTGGRKKHKKHKKRKTKHKKRKTKHKKHKKRKTKHKKHKTRKTRKTKHKKRKTRKTKHRR